MFVLTGSPLAANHALVTASGDASKVKAYLSLWVWLRNPKTKRDSINNLQDIRCRTCGAVHHLLISFWPCCPLHALPVCAHCTISSNLILKIQTRATIGHALPGRTNFNPWEQFSEALWNNTLAHMLAALTIGYKLSAFFLTQNWIDGNNLESFSS